jgi:cytochrome c biogenesis protein CcmG, thiol:disulfide interchange protein DsbE
MKIATVRRQQLAAQLGVSLVAFLLVLLVWILTHSNNSVAAALDRGKTPRAPSFSISSLSGQHSVELTTYGGRVIVINFWASWCGPCRGETPALEHAWQKWKTHLVTFIGVDVRDSRADARSFTKHAQISYLVGHDGSGVTGRAYGVGALPATFIVSPRGRVVARFLGPVSEQTLDAAIRRALRRAGAS